MLEVEFLFLLGFACGVSERQYAELYQTLISFNPLMVGSPAAPDGQEAIPIDASVRKMPGDMPRDDKAVDADRQEGFRICFACHVLYWPQYAPPGACTGIGSGGNHQPFDVRYALRYSATGQTTFRNGQTIFEGREIGYRSCTDCGVVYWHGYPNVCTSRPGSNASANQPGCQAHRASGVAPTSIQHRPHPYCFSLTQTLATAAPSKVCARCGVVYLPGADDNGGGNIRHAPHAFSFQLHTCAPPAPSPNSSTAVAAPPPDLSSTVPRPPPDNPSTAPTVVAPCRPRNPCAVAAPERPSVVAPCTVGAPPHHPCAVAPERPSVVAPCTVGAPPHHPCAVAPERPSVVAPCTVGAPPHHPCAVAPRAVPAQQRPASTSERELLTLTQNLSHLAITLARNALGP